MSTSETLNLDTSRRIRSTLSVTADTLRSTAYKIELSADTSRSLPWQMNNAPVRRVQIAMREGSVSDTVSVEAMANIKPKERMTGRVLDYEYDMLVHDATYKNGWASVNSMYRFNDILYKYVPCKPGSRAYKVVTINGGTDIGGTTTTTKKASAKNLLGYFSKLIGVSVTCMFDDFSQDYSYSGKYVRPINLLQTVLGWSNDIPTKMLNVICRGNSMTIIQRGHEPNTVNLDDLLDKCYIERESIEREMYYPDCDIPMYELSGVSNAGVHINASSSIDNTSDDSSDTDDTPQEEPYDDSGYHVEYFTGTVRCGNVSLGYENGLLVSKTVLVPDSEDHEVEYDGEYDYDEYRRTTSKIETKNDGTKTVTSIKWAGDSNNPSNHTTETTYDSETNDVITERVTINEDLGNGFVGTSVYVDGGYQGSSISGSGVCSNRYTNEQQSLQSYGTKNGNNAPWRDSDGNSASDGLGSVGGRSHRDTRINKEHKRFAIDYYESVQETVTLDIVCAVVNCVAAYGHVIDFLDKISYKGNEYFLSSNNVSLTPTELRQSVSFVRWIK